MNQSTSGYIVLAAYHFSLSQSENCAASDQETVGEHENTEHTGALPDTKKLMTTFIYFILRP